MNIPYTDAELTKIARSQRELIWLILLWLAAYLIAFWLPLLSVGLAVFLWVYLYEFAKALKSPRPANYLALAIIPLMGPIVMLILNGKATKALRARGLQVGLMGANKEEIHKLIAECPASVEQSGAVAKPAAEAPLLCAQTNSQPADEPPRQIPAPKGPRPKWPTRRLAVGTATALAIIAGLVAVWMWRGGAQPKKLHAFSFEEAQATPTWNETEALRTRAEKGDAKAQYDLGCRYYSGEGVHQSHVEAAKWYRKAADQGDTTAQWKLGCCYHLGHGVPQDCAEAVKWYLKAAERGNATAQLDLGGCYFEGQIVKQDYAEAAKWWRKAAEQGDVFAQGNLGLCYYNGYGVQQAYAEALKWCRKAAEQGDGGGQHNLAKCYAEGKGVPKNDIEAYKWLSLAAAQGIEDSAKGRDRISQRMARAEIVEGQRRAAAFVVKQERTKTGADGIPPAPEIGAGKRCAGTGFFVTDDGYFVTCEHVVRGASSFHVRSPSGSLPARLIKKDRTIDVAVLKVDGVFRALPVVAQPRVKLGEAVFTIGFPNTVVQGVEPKLTRGEISSMAGIRDNPRYFQVSVPVQPGNSGGALVDESGNAVGVVTSRLDDVATYEISGALPQNVNYAVKSSVVYDFLNRIPELSGKLKAPSTAKDRQLASAAAERAAVLVVAE